MNYEVPKARVEDIELDEYRDSRSIAQWTTWLLFANLGCILFLIGSDVLERQTLSAIRMGAFASVDEMRAAASASDHRQAMVAAAEFLIFAAAGVMCLRWIHRMAFNARIKASTMKFSPGWAVGWYFIPIAYWWKPFQAMREIWEKSAEQAGARGDRSEMLLASWWALWVIFLLLTYIASQVALHNTQIDMLQFANLIQIGGEIVHLPLIIVFIVMVKRLTAMQQYAHENPIDVSAKESFPGANW